jgi:hypothetical protein
LSTILKALKRAEQDCKDQGTKTNLSLNVLKKLKSENQGQRPGLWMSFGWIVSALGVILVVWGGAYWLLAWNDPGSRPLSRETPFSSPVPGPAEPYDDTPAVRQIPLSTPVQAQAPVLAPAPGPDLSLQSRPDTTEKATETITEKVPEKTKKKISNLSPVPREILPLQEGSLKIQAISWAEDPSDRIAVINSKILEQGESIQGYRVVHIKEETVILEHSGREYELAFDYR